MPLFPENRKINFLRLFTRTKFQQSGISYCKLVCFEQCVNKSSIFAQNGVEMTKAPPKVLISICLERTGAAVSREVQTNDRSLRVGARKELMTWNPASLENGGSSWIAAEAVAAFPCSLYSSCQSARGTGARYRSGELNLRCSRPVRREFRCAHHRCCLLLRLLK